MILPTFLKRFFNRRYSLLLALFVVTFSVLGIFLDGVFSIKNKLKSSTIYSVGALESPKEEVFGAGIRVEVTEDSSLYVGDPSVGKVRYFDKKGRHVKTVGGKGGGPGEFRNIDEISLGTSGDSLFVYDNSNQRVSVYTVDPLNYNRDFRIKDRGASPATDMCVSASSITISGDHSENNKVFHKYNKRGKYKYSLVEVPIFDSDKHPKSVKRQLSQGQISCENKEINVALSNPIEIYTFVNKSKKWESTVDILPNPMKFIDYSKGSFSTEFYPMLTNVSVNTEGKLLFAVTYPDKKRSVVSLLDKKSKSVLDSLDYSMSVTQSIRMVEEGKFVMARVTREDFPAVEVSRVTYNK